MHRRENPSEQSRLDKPMSMTSQLPGPTALGRMSGLGHSSLSVSLALPAPYRRVPAESKVVCGQRTGNISANINTSFCCPLPETAVNKFSQGSQANALLTVTCTLGMVGWGGEVVVVQSIKCLPTNIRT